MNELIEALTALLERGIVVERLAGGASRIALAQGNEVTTAQNEINAEAALQKMLTEGKGLTW